MTRVHCGFMAGDSAGSFIRPDEHIILFDWPTGALAEADLWAIREIGVRTAYVFMWWHQVEPRRGVYNWTVPDFAVNRLLGADYKVLLLCHGNAVHWGPDNWYCRMPDGRLWRNFNGYGEGFGYSVISPWSTEGRAYELDFMRRARDRYASDSVLVVPGSVHGGEAIMPGMIESWHDEAALASYRTFVGDATAQPATIHTPVDLTDPAKATTVTWLTTSLVDYITENHRVMMQTQRDREVWLMLPQRNTEYAEAVETGPRSGNWLAPTLYEVLPFGLSANLNIMLFEAYRAGGDQGIFEGVKGLESVTWVGSQYTEGLRTNTARAIQQGLRGFLTGPLHPDSRERKVTPDMLEAFAWSLAQWREARP